MDGSDESRVNPPASDGADPAADDDIKTAVQEVVVPFDQLLTQTFPWGSFSYQVEQIETRKTTAPGVIIQSAVEVTIQVRNLVNRENTQSLDWDLLLADGTRLESKSVGYHRPNPLERGTFCVEFRSEQDLDIIGTSLQPYDSSLTRYAPLVVPIDFKVEQWRVTLAECAEVA